MEYLLGSMVTAIAMFFSYKVIMKTNNTVKPMKVIANQSRTNELIKKILFPDQSFPPATSQAMKHFDGLHTRILILENKAYWISNNAVFSADIIDGEVEKESALEVDTMGMDNVQLKQMMFIVEKLKEGL